MAYPQRIYTKADQILEKRRAQSEEAKDLRCEKIRKQIPEIDDIQKQLTKIGLSLSLLFFKKENGPSEVERLKKRSKELIERRNEVLIQNGYDKDIMQTEHVCSICEDKGVVNGHKCKCYIELLKEIMRDELRKIAPIDNCTFGNFSLDYYSSTPDENNISPRQKAELALDSAMRYSQNFSMASKNIIFSGGTGLGKTHLSLAIANAAIDHGYYVCYGTSQNICDDLQSEQFGRNYYRYNKNMVLNCELLILDDLGTEVNNPYTISIINNIIDSRLISNKPTIISTNCSMRELLTNYDQRITSRISGEYVGIHLAGQDIRNIN